MLGLNRNQWLGIAIVIVSALSISTANLTDIFGAGVAKVIVSACSMLTTIFGGIVTVITGQTGMAQQLGNLTGVKVQVDATADPSLAKLAVSPDNNGIEPAPGQGADVAKVATQ